MRKKVFLLLSFVLALAMSIGILTACGGGKKVTVDNMPETLTLVVGGSGKTLPTTASDGKGLTWSSDNEGVATVSNAGRVTPVASGTATITATAVSNSKVSATCVVTVKTKPTFTFRDASGNTITSVEVDRNGEPVKITAIASDGDTITSWESDDPTIATVTNSGVVTGKREGDTALTVKTAYGSGTIDVHVIDTAEHEAIVEGAGAAKAGEWWYYLSDKDNRSPEIITSEVREGIVTFEFGGNVNWNKGDVQLGQKKDSTAKTGWTAFSGKITSSVDGTVSIFDTTVTLVAGEETAFEVYYDQLINENMVYITPDNNIAAAEFIIKIEDLDWQDYTPPTLDAPTGISINEKTVTITDDSNTAGVKEYLIGFFNNAEDAEPAYVQSFTAKTGEIDPMVIETVGTYVVKVKTAGIPGYLDSAWSEATAQYTVSSVNIEYDLEMTTTYSSTRWTYFAVAADGSYASEASYANGVVTYKSAGLGWKFDSTQIYRHYATYEAGQSLKLVMKVTTIKEGTILVCGEPYALTVGENTLKVFFEQPASGATITIMFGDPTATFDWSGEVDFQFEVVSIEKYTPPALDAPSATLEGTGEDKVITIAEYADEDKVSKYEVGFFDENGECKGYTAILKDGSFSDMAIENGFYTLKIRAVPKTGEYASSEWNAITGGENYEVKNSVKITPLPNGGEHDSYVDPDVWYEWHDQSWNGSTVRVDEGYTTSTGEIHFSFTITAGSNKYDQAAHLYYHYSTLTPGNPYTLTLKINSTVACVVDINGEKVSLKVGNNDVTVNFIHIEENADWQGNPQGATIRIYFNNSGSYILSDVKVETLTQTKLQAPSIAIDANGIVTVTDPNTVGVGSYVAGFYQGNKLAGSTTVVSGEAIDVSMVESGNYTVKIMAKSADVAYLDSDWSAGITYNVVNDKGVKYELGTDTPDAGKWSYWAATNGEWTGWTAWVTELKKAEYDNGNVTIAFTATDNDQNPGKTCAHGVQFKYTNPNEGTNCTFTITATQNCGIDVGEVHYNLVAGEAKQISFSGTKEFYLQVNLAGKMDISVTISNVQWN